MHSIDNRSVRFVEKNCRRDAESNRNDAGDDLNGAIDDGVLGAERRQRDVTYFARHLPSVRIFKSI